MVALLLLAWALNVWVPILLLRPMWESSDSYLELEETATETPAPVRPPSILTPLLAIIVGLAAFAFGVWQMYEAEEIGGRWLWATAAGGLAVLCAVVLLVMVLSAAAHYAEQHAALHCVLPLGCFLRVPLTHRANIITIGRSSEPL